MLYLDESDTRARLSLRSWGGIHVLGSADERLMGKEEPGEARWWIDCNDVDYLRPWREDMAALSLKSTHLCSRGNAKSGWSRYTSMLLKVWTHDKET